MSILLLASMLLPLSMLLLAPMLLQVFLLLLALLLLASIALYTVHVVASTRAVAGVSAVVGPSVTGVNNMIMLRLIVLSDACSSLAHAGKVFWSLEGAFTLPRAEKYLAPGIRRLFRHVGMYSKTSSSRDQKIFSIGECKKNSVGG
jgi:hypothetical protein